MVTSKDNTVESYLRSLCTNGRAGDRLPSVREIQRRFRVSPVTVQRALRTLVMEGRVVTKPGDGTYISTLGSAVPTPQDHTWQTAVLGRAREVPPGLDHLADARSSAVLGLDNAFPDPGLQAQELLAKAAARCAKRSDAWDRCPPQGLPALRAVFAAELGMPFTEADVLITPGAQAALDSVFRVLARPGDPVVLEDPCYPGAIVAASWNGLVPTPVPTDVHGVLPDALADVLARSGARLMVIQPRHSNPTGSILSADRRAAVLSIAAEFGCFVVEDDWVRDLDLDGPTGPPLIVDDGDGHVISVRSLSKAAAPGLRIAAVIARGPALARLIGARLATDFFAAPLLQCVATELLASPGWNRHLVTMRAALAERRDTLVASLATYAPNLRCVPPKGGVALWTELPADVDERAVAAACAERGVQVSVGNTYRLTEASRGCLRLAFAKDDAASLTVAGRRIGAAIDSVR
jgi:DNA-binding transcriptional MocR family regulator